MILFFFKAELFFFFLRVKKKDPVLDFHYLFLKSKRTGLSTAAALTPGARSQQGELSAGAVSTWVSFGSPKQAGS